MAQRAVHLSKVLAFAVIPMNEDIAVPAFMDMDIMQRKVVESSAGYDGGRLRGLR
jgi:hypothetical protein